MNPLHKGCPPPLAKPGGANSAGVLYSYDLDPSGMGYEVLHNFDITTGGVPVAGVYAGRIGSISVFGLGYQRY